jgi:hypothetical protein
MIPHPTASQLVGRICSALGSCLIALFRWVCRDCKCPQLRPRIFQSIPGIDILQTGSVQVGFLLLTTRPTREDKYLRALEVRVATWVLLGEKNGTRDQINLEPPGGVAGEFWPM